MKLGSCATLMIGAMLLVMGCGPGGPATVPVKGKVTKGGVGLANVSVSLVDQGKPNDNASGTTDSKGEFELTYGTQGKKGAVPGKYKVVLTGGGVAPTAGTASAPPTGYGGGGKTNTTPVLDTPYDKKWGNYESSPLEIDVKSGMEPLDIKVD